MAQNETQALLQELKTQAVILGSFVGLMWVVFFSNWLFLGGRLYTLGIQPHSLVGLRGIIFAPFLHGSLLHLLSNTLPFLTLGWLVMWRETRDFWPVTLIVWLVSGLGTWLIGAPTSLHIGASGLVFGYLGYLIMRGYFDRSIPAIAFSVGVILLYGGMLWGILPLSQGISWQGHLFGLIGGSLAAYQLSPRSSRRRS
ncbi:rhomboid family intramembrane serine protease [Trichothermofontia sp.]